MSKAGKTNAPAYDRGVGPLDGLTWRSLRREVAVDGRGDVVDHTDYSISAHDAMSSRPDPDTCNRFLPEDEHERYLDERWVMADASNPAMTSVPPVHH